MPTARREFRIEWGDCDPAGIVFYPRYFAWFDACTGGLFADAGLPKHEMLKTYGIVGIPMVDTRAKFIVPSKFGDLVRVETRISAFRRSSFDVEHRLMKGARCWRSKPGRHGCGPPGIRTIPRDSRHSPFRRR